MLFHEGSSSWEANGSLATDENLQTLVMDPTNALHCLQQPDLKYGF